MKKPPREILAVGFDVDGTLVEHPEGKTVWQLVNERFGGGEEENRRRLAAYRAGAMSYERWVDLDLGDWVAAGVSRADLTAAIAENLALVPGARQTVEELRERGYRLAVISGTIDLTLELLLGDFPFDRRYTNQVWFDRAGAIAGWRATPFDGPGKARALEEFAAACGCAAEQCAFIGDHWNDLDALRRAGLGIAYRPKDEAVRQTADRVIEDGPLSAVLDILESVRNR